MNWRALIALPAFVLAVFLLFFALWPAQEGGVVSPEARRPAFARETIFIRRQDGLKIPFDVEVAATIEERAYGLMFRREPLGRGEGMLFVSAEPEIARFWMKNTYIPLDIIFIRADGRIAKIAARAAPLNPTPIVSDEPVLSVLEIGGGQAAALGIKAGDRLGR